jgi:serine/threonine protein phosphatase PrpC
MLEGVKKIQTGGGELQDRAEILHIERGLIAIVADGAGGMSGGAEAAQFVIDRIKKEVELLSLGGEEFKHFLVRLDKEIASDRACGETTCAVAAVKEGMVIGASVGDSGAWMISESSVENLTAHQCRKPLLGSGSAVPVSFEWPQLQGTLLLASDGLLKYTSQEQIAAVVRNSNLENSVQKLLDLVRYPSGAFPDDISVILVRNK